MNKLKKCEVCGGEMAVIDTREFLGKAIWRKRKCRECGQTVFTLEDETDKSLAEGGCYRKEGMRNEA